MARSYARAATALIVGTSIAWACADPFVGGVGDSDIDFDRRAMLSSIADRVIVPTVTEFATAADELVAATEAYASALAGGAPDVADKKLAAQAAWSAAMDVWQRAEAMRIGPAGSSISAVAGQDLGDEIYSWPTSNPCAVDQALVERDYEAGDFFDTALVNVYGLDALEYLLFYDAPDNTCPGQLPINAGPWDALGEAEVAQRRADYAVAVAGDLAATAHALAQAWDRNGGDFASALAAPGEGGSPYESEAVAVDAVLGGVAYVDIVLKDIKIARPGGLADCAAAACPADLESPWSGRARENALANLEGLRLMFLGGASPGDGTGFDDFLAAAGDQALADQILADIDAAAATMEAMDTTFAEALAADTSALDPSYAAIKKITDAIKGPFATTLQIRLPAEAAGDAD